MADVQHVSLPDALLHQPKGAASAAVDTWMRANGDGTTSFTPLPTFELIGTDVLVSESTVDQLLVNEDDQATVAFGPAAISTGGSVSIDANGVITFNETGLYSLSVRGFFGRTSSAGVSTVLVAGFLNGVQSDSTVPVNLDDDDVGFDVSVTDSRVVYLPAGTTLDYRIYLENDAGGEAGLITSTHAGTGFDATPSAKITIRKLEVA